MEKYKSGAKKGQNTKAREQQKRRLAELEDPLLFRLKEMQARQEALAETMRTQLNVIVKLMVMIKNLLDEEKPTLKVDHNTKSPYIK